MLILLEIVLPVFLIVGVGYGATKRNLMPAEATKILSGFAQNFAIPCLLFLAVSKLDLSKNFKIGLLGSFYIAAFICFALGIYLSLKLFHRRPGESVSVGFGALFSNSVLLGLPIMERAYGAESLEPNYAIISVHSVTMYTIGVTMMELVRADGRSLQDTGKAIFQSLSHNALVIGLACGFFVNLTGLPLPQVVSDAARMLANAGLPVALFSLGGVLAQYGLRANLPQAFTISALSLLVHPALTYFLGTQVFDLSEGFLRGAVLTAAMAPGVNAYIFAALYNRAVDTAATTVFLATGLSVFTVTGWLWILGT